jgi:deoxyribodipyrimidine photo-lyase
MSVDERVRVLNDFGIRPGGRYVLYWRRWNRRGEANHAMVFAAGLANSLDLPLLVLESLPCSYPYANDRLHTFVLEGVPEAETGLRRLGVGYVFHLERHPGDADRALRELARDAAAVATDEYPLPAPEIDLDVAGYAVDSCGVIPSAAIPGRVYAAYSMRPKIRELLPRFLKPVPAFRVLRRFESGVPAFHTAVTAASIPDLVSGCPIDHTVRPALGFRGGRREARRRLATFLRYRLARYSREKNEPAARATSGLSPYLHCGFISALEVALAARHHAAEHKLMADEFLEELIVRRELAFNFARHAARVDSLEELPGWARATLDRHRSDPRDPLYTPEQFERAATYDDLWNATQKELLLRGKIHGYYRMYWGKKILEWSASPEEALATMVRLHGRYALDGQDPNTYANILWCFGLHDRPWPERPIFGTVRSMSRAGMNRRTDAASYIRQIEYLERTGREHAT